MHRNVEQGQPYLFRRDVPASEIHRTLTSFAYSLPTAVRYWHQLLERRTPRDIVAGFRKIDEGENVIEHALEGIEFSLSLVNEHKRANGLRAGVLTHNIDPALLSVFGLDLTYAMNHSDFTDHAIPHVRRIHRVMDQIILRVPELRHNASIDRWLPALELFPHNHDMDQVLTLFRNKIMMRELESEGRKDEYKEKKLTAKAAHGLAAAVMTMALAGRYREEGGMTELDAAKARRNAFAAAIMIAKHEEPDKIDEAFAPDMTARKKGTFKRIHKYQGSDPRYRRKNGEDLLIEDFDKNRVDIFSLSPRQMVQILRRKKSAAGRFVTDENPYGLHPHFTREYWEELRTLEHDIEPMFPDLTKDERESFILAAKVAVFADEVEMIYPPYPSIMRSLKTDISRSRSWWPKHATVELLTAAIESQGGNYRGEFSSDAYRLFWETWEMIQKAKRSKHRNNDIAGRTDGKQVFDLISAPYVNQIMKEHVLMRLLAVREFGGRIMSGDFGIIDEIYASRSESLTRKALARSKKISALKKIGLRRNMKPEDVAGALQQSGEDELWDRFTFRQRILWREAEELKTILQNKPSAMEYEPEDIQVFREMCDRLIGEACEVFDISENEARAIEEKMMSGRDFYKTYDPLGGLPDTIREPAHFDEWKSLLSGKIRGTAFWNMREQAVQAENQLFDTIRTREEKTLIERRLRRPSTS